MSPYVRENITLLYYNDQMFKEKIAICYENHKKWKYILRGQNAELLTAKAGEERSLPNSSYYVGICLKKLRKTRKNLTKDSWSAGQKFTTAKHPIATPILPTDSETRIRQNYRPRYDISIFETRHICCTRTMAKMLILFFYICVKHRLSFRT
jgi:hypothetical protein